MSDLRRCECGGTAQLLWLGVWMVECQRCFSRLCREDEAEAMKAWDDRFCNLKLQGVAGSNN